jgi:uncharacterized protein (DUF433 family)
LIVDSRICHGQPTFRGTRILVKDVLEQVAQGMAWKSIEKHWRGAVGPAAISEAVRLAHEAFFEQWPISNCGDHQAPLHEKRKNKPGIRAPKRRGRFTHSEIRKAIRKVTAARRAGQPVSVADDSR